MKNDNDQFEIARDGMEQVARIGAEFGNDLSVSKLVAFKDSLRAIRADITAVDLESLPVDKRERESQCG